MILFPVVLSFILVSIEAIYQTLIPKHLEVYQKHSATRRTFNSLLGVWKYGQIWPFSWQLITGCYFHPKFNAGVGFIKTSASQSVVHLSLVKTVHPPPPPAPSPFHCSGIMGKSRDTKTTRSERTE